MAAIAHLFLRERLSRFQFFGLCGALCGVSILVSRGRLGTLLGLRFAQGDLWMLLSVFLFAVYSLMLRCRPKAFPQKAFLALLIGIGVLGLIPPRLWQAADTGLSPLDGSILSALIYIGVGASVVSFLSLIHICGFSFAGTTGQCAPQTRGHGQAGHQREQDGLRTNPAAPEPFARDKLDGEHSNHGQKRHEMCIRDSVYTQGVSGRAAF